MYPNIHNDLSTNQILDVFIHQALDKIGITPHNDKLFKLLNTSVDLSSHSKNHHDYIFSENKVGLKNITSMYLLDKDKYNGSVFIKFVNVTSIIISINEVRYGQKKYNKVDYDCKIKCNEQNESIMYISINNFNKTDILDTIIEFYCTETNNTSNIYEIVSMHYDKL